MPAKRMDLTFPLRGINDAWAFGEQPEGTTPDASNVTPFDSLDSRARGGQRPGLSKYFEDQHNGSAALQRMTTVTAVGDSGSSSSYAFTQGDGLLDDTQWYPLEFATGPSRYIVSATEPAVSGNAILRSEGDNDNRATIGIYKTLRSTSSTYTVSVDVSITLGTAAGIDEVQGIAGLVVRSNGLPPITDDDFVETEVTIRRLNNTGDPLYEIHYAINRNFSATFDMTLGSDDYLDPTWWETARTLELAVSGNVMTLSVEGTFLMSQAVPDLSGNTFVGFRAKVLGPTGASTAAITVDNFVIVNSASESGRSYKLVTVSGGDVYAGLPPGVLSAATDGTNVVATSGRVDMQTAFGKIYFADGDPFHYRYFDNLDDTVKLWTTTVTNSLPCDATAGNPAYAIASATPATEKITYAGDLSGVMANGDWIKISDSTGNDGIYSVFSVVYSDPTTTVTVRQDITDATADGTFQLCDLGCNIVKLYRGRLVLAGLASDPQNWFMSAVARAFDFDYGATPSATMAVAGNNTDAGKCPDIITCLAPYSDDLMFIGGDHTLWLMRGDPADKGRIDNISYQTGISGPDAYAFDPNGVFYFFGRGTIWRMSIEGSPEPLSRNRMDQAFGAIDLTTHTVHMAWDNVRHGLFMFVVPSGAGATTHYYWDERTDSFWKIAFPNAQGPTTAFAFDGDRPDDNALLLGGWDGYIRQVDPSATNDDGTAISSYVYYPIISVGGSLRNTLVNSITTVLDTNSDAVTLTAYAEDTPQKALESTTPRFVRTLPAGRTRIVNRVAGNAIALKLSNSVDETTWAIENLIVTAKATGLTRKNQL